MSLIYPRISQGARIFCYTPWPGRTVLDAERPDRVVIETGFSAGWVGDLVRDRGVELEVAYPSHEAWRWRSLGTWTPAVRIGVVSQQSTGPPQQPPCTRPARQLEQEVGPIGLRLLPRHLTTPAS